MTGSMLTLPLRPQWRITTVLLLMVILLMVLVSPFNLHAPAAVEGAVPTATVTPTVIATPNPTPASPADTATSDEGDTQAHAEGLFSGVEGDPPPSTEVETLASRLVDIDFEQLASVTNPPTGPKGPSEGEPLRPQTLVLNLFEDVVFTCIVEHVEPTSSGHALWGRLEGEELGTMTMVVNGSIVVGTVRTPSAVYTIRTAGDGTYVIRQVDESSLPPLGEPLEDNLFSGDTNTDANDPQADDGSQIDVMVVYTPLVRRQQGGRAAIEALIDLLVTETNQAYENSGVIHRIRLVLREEVDYVEDGDSSIDLDRLASYPDEYMDHIHMLRDLYAADLVHILVGRSDFGGLAQRGGEFGLTAGFVGLTFTHELGHNMGLRHDRYTSGVPRTGFRYGYVNQRAFEPGAPVSARWITIMAYGRQCSEVGHFGCPQVAYFSNPELTYNGDPMGVPFDHPSTGADGPADAVRGLNERREITANFRRSSAAPTPRVGLTLSPYWLSENEGTSRLTATLHRPSTKDTTVAVSVSPSHAVNLGGDGTLTIPAGETVSVNSLMISGVDNGDQTGDVSVEISATAENPSDLGVIAPKPVVLSIADDETTPVVTLVLSPAEIVEGGEPSLVTATLDNRSSADTTIAVSTSPADPNVEILSGTLSIPAGQTTSKGYGVLIYAIDDDNLAEVEKTVTVFGTATNPHGITGPESVTLAIIDDEAPHFADDSTSYTFTVGLESTRFLPTAADGDGILTYSMSPAPSNGVTFVPSHSASINVATTAVVSDETSYTLTATDEDGDFGTMTINITIAERVCPNSAAVSGYTDPGIIADCEVLLASRDTLRGDQSLNWSEDESIDSWQDIVISDNRVKNLNLFGLGLSGTIPSELGGLTALRGLSLGGNELAGQMPPQLGNLSNLEYLTLYENRVTGDIPAELGNLSNLRELQLSSNRLTGGIPAEFGNLSNLERLELFGNQLDGNIPTALGGLTNLRVMLLSSNRLTGEIPAELGKLSNLRVLVLNRNQLTGNLPAELGNLSNLEDLLLIENRLAGEIPAELGNLSSLEALWLNRNQLTGSIPAELEKLDNLLQLFLFENRLTGCIPDGLRDVPRSDLWRLGLPYCSDHPCVTGGAVSNAMDTGLISDCEALLEGRDMLAGTATLNWSVDTPVAEWDGVKIGGTPQRVTRIVLHNKGLNGTVPESLGRLSGLTDLYLSNNGLTESIPAELGDLYNLRVLNLRSNELTDEIPDQLGDLRNLKVLNLHSNNLSGDIPDLSGMTSLAELYLPNNADYNEDDSKVPGSGLTGEIPTWLNDMTNLKELWLWGNSLSGSIPDLSGMTSLRKLKLANNDLTGGIPEASELPPNMTWLIIDRNPLGDTIPDLSSLSRLRLLWLHSNELRGSIPSDDMLPASLDDLNLRDNMLTGTIPDLSNLDNLTRLRLHNNSLSGEVPATLGGLDSLRQLWLHNEVDKGLGNNSFTSIAAGVGGLADSLIEIALNGNPWANDACVPAELANVAKNDYTEAGIEVCARAEGL